jgi:putative ABC transport system permease protein
MLTLALGLGVFCTVFGIFDGILLRPLPYEQPDRLLKIWETFAKEPEVAFPSSEVALVHLRAASRTFQRVAGYTLSRANLTGPQEPEQIWVARVSPDLFLLLGVKPLAGRLFAPEEEEPLRDRVALLGAATWHRRFGSDPGAVGRPLELNGERYTIVGILPPSFRFPRRPDAEPEIWVPEAIDRARLATTPWGRRGRYLDVVARLRPGVSLEQAEADLDRVAATFRERYARHFQADSGWGFRAAPLLRAETRDVRPALFALLGAGGLVLLITCANVGNLLSLRAQRRGREIAVRMALGASRAHMVRQILLEGALLGALGGLLGVLLAIWGTGLLKSFVPAGIPRFDETGLAVSTLAATCLASLLAGTAAGLVAAAQVPGADLPRRLKEGGKSSLGRGSRRLRSTLVVLEVTLASSILIGAGLLLENYRRLQQVDPGFSPRGVLTLGLSLPPARYGSAERIYAFYQRLLEEVHGLSGIEAAGLTSSLPMGGIRSSHGISVEDRPVAPGKMLHEVDVQAVSPGYFAAMGIPLLQGRPCTDEDRDGSPGVVVVDRRLAERFGLGPDPIGKRLKGGAPESSAPWLTIVGVVGHVKQLGLDADQERDQLYYCYLQESSPVMSLVVRTQPGAEAGLTDAIRRRVLEIDPGQPIADVRTQESLLTASLGKARFSTLLLVIFAAAGLLLAAAGTYGVLSTSTAERMREIAIRMALGARRSEVVRMIVGQGMRLGLIGCIAGVLITVASSSLLAGQIREVSPAEPSVLVAALALILGIVLAATLLPAFRAVRAAPVDSLRSD